MVWFEIWGISVWLMPVSCQSWRLSLFVLNSGWKSQGTEHSIRLHAIFLTLVYYPTKRSLGSNTEPYRQCTFFTSYRYQIWQQFLLSLRCPNMVYLNKSGLSSGRLHSLLAVIKLCFVVCERERLTKLSRLNVHANAVKHMVSPTHKWV
jgi:hypothetical protein